jgi:hypothetical protein
MDQSMHGAVARIPHCHFPLLKQKHSRWCMDRLKRATIDWVGHIDRDDTGYICSLWLGDGRDGKTGNVFWCLFFHWWWYAWAWPTIKEIVRNSDMVFKTQLWLLFFYIKKYLLKSYIYVYFYGNVFQNKSIDVIFTFRNSTKLKVIHNLYSQYTAGVLLTKVSCWRSWSVVRSCA